MPYVIVSGCGVKRIQDGSPAEPEMTLLTVSAPSLHGLLPAAAESLPVCHGDKE